MENDALRKLRTPPRAIGVKSNNGGLRCSNRVAPIGMSRRAEAELVGRSVGRSVGWSVGRSVGRSAVRSRRDGALCRTYVAR